MTLQMQLQFEIVHSFSGCTYFFLCYRENCSGAQ